MDRIQKAFEEIKQLNNELRASRQIVEEFKKSMEDQCLAKERMEQLIKGLESILPEPQRVDSDRKDDNNVVKIFGLNYDFDHVYFAVGSDTYNYNEQKILQMEREYLHDKLQDSCQERAPEKKHKI